MTNQNNDDMNRQNQQNAGKDWDNQKGNQQGSQQGNQQGGAGNQQGGNAGQQSGQPGQGSQSGKTGQSGRQLDDNKDDLGRDASKSGASKTGGSGM